MLLKKSKLKSKNFQKKNDNENTTTQNLWDAAKAVLRGKFIAIQSYLKKQEKQLGKKRPKPPKLVEGKKS